MYDKKNALTIIISIVISLIIIEFSLRIIGYKKYEFKGYPPYYLTRVGDYDNFDIKTDIKEKDFIFNDSTPHKVWGNEIGCFDESIENISDNYVLVAGDSNSWGYVPYEKNWSYLLEKKLKRKVLNCGVPAYSTIQELYKTKKILGKLKLFEKSYANVNSYKILQKPSLIILQYTFNNDFLGDYLFPQYKIQNNILTINKKLNNIFNGSISYNEENKFWQRLEYDLNEKFYLFRFLHRSFSFINNKIKNFNSKKETPSDFSLPPRFVLTSFDLSYLNFEKVPWAKKAWKDHLKNILEFKKTSDDVGAKFLFVFWGNIPEYSRKNLKEALAINKKLKKHEQIITLNNDKLLFEFLEQNNINYLNLSALAWDLVGYESITDKGEKLRNLLIWKKDNHPNIGGNKFMFEKIYNKLLNDNIIDTEANK